MSTPVENYQTGALTVIEALVQSFRDMAREDIDGEAGHVTYSEVIAGLEAARQIIETIG